jgi:hypothetical protein
MPNITMAIEKPLLDKARAYTRRQHTTVNALIRDLLRQTVAPREDNWTEKLFRDMDAVNAHSGGKRWPREELYER